MNILVVQFVLIKRNKKNTLAYTFKTGSPLLAEVLREALEWFLTSISTWPCQTDNQTEERLN